MEKEKPSTDQKIKTRAIKSHSQDLTSSSVCNEIIYKKKKTKTNKKMNRVNKALYLIHNRPTLKGLQIHMYQCH